MATESKHEQIMVALAAAMATISGAEYHYASPTVARVPWFEDEMLDSSIDLIYLVRPGDENHMEESSSGGLLAEAEIFVLLAKRFSAASENPFSGGDDPKRVTVVNRVVRDFLRKLWSDVQLGGSLGINNLVKDSLVVDRARLISGWALAEVRFVIAYSYLSDTP